MATWPTVIGCEVALRLAKISGDSEDTDTNPDWAPEVGSRIVLSPSIAGQLVVYTPNDGSRPIVVKVMSVNAVVGEDGFMYQPSPDDPTVASQRKVYVLPTDDDRLSVTGWTWTLRMDGGAIGPFSAPSGGVTYLADYVTAPAVDQTKYWVDRIPELIATMNSAIGAGTGAVEAAAQAKSSATSAATSAQTATSARQGAELARDQVLMKVVSGLKWSGTVDLTTLANNPIELQAALKGNATLNLPSPPTDRTYEVVLTIEGDASNLYSFNIPNVRWTQGSSHIFLTEGAGGRFIRVRLRVSPIYGWVGSWELVNRNTLTGSISESRRNLSIRPRGVQTWNSNNQGTNPLQKNQPVPAPHPMGIDTCNKQTNVNGDNRTIGSVYNIDGLHVSAVADRVNAYRGVWVYPNFAALVKLGALNGAGKPAPANKWTFVTTDSLIDASMLAIETQDGLANPDAVVWMTGSITSRDPITDYFDGDTPDCRWLGIIDSSESAKYVFVSD